MTVSERKLLLVLFYLIISTQIFADNWPMWRYDAERTASTPEQLPAELHLQWTRHYTPREMVWDDPLNHDLMQYDKVFEPIVIGNTLFIGFNDQDKVVALNTDTGKEIWTYYADGPVRLPIAYYNDKIYFTSDDGYLYCLSAQKGKMIWRFRGGPSERKLIGNKRLISTWPARGGVVIDEGIVYFAASIWPFMGIFIYAIEADSGNIIWKNAGTGSQFRQQPHGGAFAFAGVAPQGAMVISKEKLLIPGGRSVPACFDKNSGELLYYHLNRFTKTGGAFVCASNGTIINHFRNRNTHLYRLNDGEKLADVTFEKYPALGKDYYYFSGNSITARKANNPETIEWTIPVDASGDLIKAGSTLYAGGKGLITAIELATKEKPEILWEKAIAGTVGRLVAANGKLFAVTLEGEIFAFSDQDVRPIDLFPSPEKIRISNKTKQKANNILAKTETKEGYSLFFNPGKGDLLAAIAFASDLHLIAVEPDKSNLLILRRQFDKMGIKASKVAFIQGTPETIDLAPYFSSLTIIENLSSYPIKPGPLFLEKIYTVTQPFGGKIWIEGPTEQLKEYSASINKGVYEGLEIKEASKSSLLLTRAGPPKGASNWTHQYGSMANTLKSDDELVKLPLGILWFGGNSNMDVLPRHGHGPPEQIMNGKLIIEGLNSISARDVYTGRVIWKTKFTSLSTFGTYYNESYADDPLDPFYNQEHIPGANSRGTNFIVTPDLVYVVQGITLQVLDIETGKIIKSIRRPDRLRWGYIGVSGDNLIAGAHFVKYSEFLRNKHNNNEELRNYLAYIDSNDFRTGGMYNFDQSASDRLFVLDRYTFDEKWKTRSTNGFIHNAIVSDGKRLFFLDKISAAITSLLERRGISLEEDYTLAALDIETGDTLWQKTADVFGSWLGYSAEHNILLQATRPSRDMLAGEPGKRMIVYHADDGKVIWDKKIRYRNPPILYGNRIIVENAAYNILTGNRIERKDPITHEKVPWEYSRYYGCNYNIGSENLLSFRSGAAGFYDLKTGGGTGNFGGFKSGCTSNLIAANGVLNAPDYTRTCNCSYQNQTSLSLIYMPELEYWTHNSSLWSGKPVKQIGINFGAPGDRMAENNTLWLDYPSEGGNSPDIPVKVSFTSSDTSAAITYGSSLFQESTDQPGYFRTNSYEIESKGFSWVGASGVLDFSRIEITLSKEPMKNTSYTVKLFFAEVANLKSGDRLFDITIQGNPVLKNFDIVKEASGTKRLIVKTFKGIKVKDKLILQCKSLSPGKPPLLNGIEVVME
jgi:outer membrane protein assembly factor BamB